MVGFSIAEGGLVSVIFKSNIFRATILLFCAVLSGCTITLVNKSDVVINKVALASFGVDPEGRTLTDNMKPELLARIVQATEEKLSARWTVKKTTEFVGDPNYQKVVSSRTSKKSMKVMTPSYEGARMVFIPALTAQVARDLCKDLDVDAIVSIRSRWGYQKGFVIDTIRAHTMTVFELWDSSGKRVYFSNQQENGIVVGGSVGAGPVVYTKIVVNDSMVRIWFEAYERAIESLLSRYR